MPKLSSELKAAGLLITDEACARHAMFPQEFAALYKTAPARVARVSQPVAVAQVTSARGPTAITGSPRSVHLRLTIEGKTHDVQVEEVT